MEQQVVKSAMQHAPDQVSSEPDGLSADAEHAELEAVANALGHSSRLAHLLRYIGEKHFSGEGDQLSEYTIATEVFGRSRTTFDATRDAIARVEAHRLRKKLKEFYEGPGKERPIQISVAHGTYIPVFSRASGPEPAPAALYAESSHTATVIAATAGAEQQDAGKRDSGILGMERKKHSLRLYLVSIAAAVCVTLTGFYLVSRHHRVPGTTAAAMRAPTAPAALRGFPAPAVVPLRLLAGYTGPPQRDSAGAVWQADRYVHGGGPWRILTQISRTSDPFIFQQWRAGDFDYDIPLKPGDYELHLYFFTPNRSSDALSTFNVRINGNLVLRGFDINEDAMGENVADERVFRDVSPAADGVLHVSFASESGTPQLSALEVLPGIPHRQLPIRIVMQRRSLTDDSGRSWHADDYFMNGHFSDQSWQTSGSPDPELFDSERYGHFSYAIPVDPRDRYTLILHFVEFYFGPHAPGGGGIGSRVFRVMCNGNTLLDNFDIYKEAGSLHVLTKTFYHLQPSAQGKLNITFEPIVNNATVSGIEVLDESD